MDQRGFELLYSFDPAFQGCLGIDVQIHVERMALLIGYDLRINIKVTHQRRVSSTHHLRIAEALE